MFSEFKLDSIKLSKIALDRRNPRIVTQSPLTSDAEIIRYFFEHADLGNFIARIVAQGKNSAAERPYLVQDGENYVVIEGNTRIAAYKLLAGQVDAPEDFSDKVPSLPESSKQNLLTVDCSIAPTRDALLPIMASAHFGLGDKTKWGYLGSRKAVFDEWNGGKTVLQLAAAFDKPKGAIRGLILDYLLFLDALNLEWTAGEKATLLDPTVEFNPPIRFLQSEGHREKVGIEFDRPNLQILYKSPQAKVKLRHIIKKLVISPTKGLGATAKYDAVFADYKVTPDSGEGSPGNGGSNGEGSDDGGGTSEGDEAPPSKPYRLFAYPTKSTSGLIKQLMHEARDLHAKTYPAAATFLLRSLIEAILKHIIDEKKLNPQNKLQSLETALDLVIGSHVLAADDRKILKEFKNNHLDYVNMGAHATLIPNYSRLMAVRDCVDQFVKRNV